MKIATILKISLFILIHLILAAFRTHPVVVPVNLTDACQIVIRITVGNSPYLFNLAHIPLLEIFIDSVSFLSYFEYKRTHNRRQPNVKNSNHKTF